MRCTLNSLHFWRFWIQKDRRFRRKVRKTSVRIVKNCEKKSYGAKSCLFAPIFQKYRAISCLIAPFATLNVHAFVLIVFQLARYRAKWCLIKPLHHTCYRACHRPWSMFFIDFDCLINTQNWIFGICNGIPSLFVNATICFSCEFNNSLDLKLLCKWIRDLQNLCWLAISGISKLERYSNTHQF